MTLDGVKLAEVNRRFKAEFLRELGQSPRWSEELAMKRIPTTGNELKPKFASRTSGVQEWLDERQKGQLRVYDFAIPVKKWANGVQVKMDDLEDDQAALGLYADEIADMADDFKEHKHQLFIDLVSAGFGSTLGLSYDGQFFFDSDHKDHPDGPTQRNVRDLAFASTAFYTALADMGTIRKPNGLHANIRPTHGLFPEALRSAVEAVFNVQFLASGANNPLYKRVEPIFDPRLDLKSTTAWFLFDFSKRIKPVALVDRKMVGFRAKTDPNGEKMFNEDVAEWGADGRYNAGFYFWQVAWGSDGVP